MTEEKKQKTDPSNTKASPRKAIEAPAPSKSGDEKKTGTKRRVSFVGKDSRNRKRPKRGGRGAGEPDQKIIDIRRVTRVMAGGRRFSFSVAAVIGDHNGRVGVGLGKGSDTAIAIDKAVKRGKKGMIKIMLTKNKSIPKEVEAKYCSARIFIQPAKGKGLVAGSSLRNVLELAGITDVNAKVISRSKNKLNIARAAIVALSKIR